MRKELKAIKTLSELGRGQLKLERQLGDLKIGIFIFMVLMLTIGVFLVKLELDKIIEYVDNKVVVEETLEKE